MKLTFVLVLGSFSFGGPPERQAPPEDRWFARDKAQHVVAAAVLQGVGHSLLRASGADYRNASLTAGVVTLGVSVGKELWDRSHAGVPSWRDLAADAVGGGAAAVVVRQVDR